MRSPGIWGLLGSSARAPTHCLGASQTNECFRGITKRIPQVDDPSEGTADSGGLLKIFLPWTIQVRAPPTARRILTYAARDSGDGGGLTERSRGEDTQ